jgi:hypothetical protein
MTRQKWHGIGIICRDGRTEGDKESLSRLWMFSAVEVG